MDSFLEFFHLHVLTVNKLHLFCDRAHHLIPPGDYETFPSDMDSIVYKLNQSFNNYQTKNLNLIVLDDTCFDYLPYIDYFQMSDLDGWIKGDEVIIFDSTNSLISKECGKSILDKHIIGKIKFADF